MMKPSVRFFGDHLNAINVTGFFIVFLGVLLYKLAFHLEKEARMEGLQQKNEKEDVLGSLIKERIVSWDDDYEESKFVSARTVELVDRSSGNKSQRKSMTVETMPTKEGPEDGSIEQSKNLV
jgi:hypothetical protein